MSLRFLSITVAALVALSAVVWLARRAPAPASADPRVGQPLLAAELAGRAARVRLTDQGRTVDLARAGDGSWAVESYHGLPADLAKLGRFIADLEEAKVRRLATSRADRLERLEFKDAAISLVDSAGAEIWRVTLGKNADGGGRFVRYDREEKGYLAAPTPWLDAESKNWADAMLLDLKAGDIAAVEIGFPDGTSPVVASRAAADAAWASPVAPEGRRLRPDRIDAALSGLLTLRFTDTTAADDPQAAEARKHSRVVKLTTFGGTAYTVTFARKPEEKRPKPAPTDAKPQDAAAAATDQPKEPETETIPAGPAFVAIASSDPAARINQLMARRAFQIGEWTYTGVPSSPDEFWEPAPAEAPATPPPAS